MGMHRRVLLEIDYTKMIFLSQYIFKQKLKSFDIKILSDLFNIRGEVGTNCEKITEYSLMTEDYRFVRVAMCQHASIYSIRNIIL